MISLQVNLIERFLGPSCYDFDESESLLIDEVGDVLEELFVPKTLGEDLSLRQPVSTVGGKDNSILHTHDFASHDGARSTGVVGLREEVLCGP